MGYSEVSRILEQASGVNHLEMVSELFPGRITRLDQKIQIHEAVQLTVQQ